MNDQDFERRLASRLHEDTEHGLRPYDALEIARVAMASGARAGRTDARRQGGMPAWFRSLVLAGVLVVLLVVAAFAGGLIRLPNPVVVPTPSPTSVTVQSPTPTASLASLPPTLTPTSAPSASVSPSVEPSPDGSPSPSPTISPEPSPSPSPEPSPTASPTPATGWREVEFPAGRRVNLMDAARSGNGFVVVGLGGSAGRSWHSADGVSWSRSQDAAFPGAHHVVARQGQYYAFSSGSVWRSADGLNWTSIAPGALEIVYDVTVEDGVIIAVGASGDFDEARIWTSTDGISWSSLGAPDGASELTGVAARGGDIVVIGDGGFEGHGRRLYFRPSHATGWEQVPVFGEDQDGRLLEVASNGSRFVAVGYEDDIERGFRQGLAFSSSDGSSWSRTLVGDHGLVFDQITVLPGNRFLVVASLREYWVGECQPFACVFLYEAAHSYVSDSGVSWAEGAQLYEREEESPPEVGDMVEHPRGVAVGPQGVVVADNWSDGPHVFFAPAGTYP